MSIYLRGLSQALGQAGHHIDLFTRSAGKEKVEAVAPGVRLISVDDGEGALDKSEIYPHREAIAAAIESFCSSTALNYDLIFSHYWLSGVVGSMLQQKWKLPHLVMFHTLGRAKNEACSGEKEPLIRLEEEERLARECSGVVVAAESEKINTVRYFSLDPEKVAIIPSGIDRNLFKPPLPDSAEKFFRKETGSDNTKVILAVGRLEPVKGFDLLFRAFALLPDRDNLKLILIGGEGRNGRQSEALKKLAAELNIEERVIFMGLIEHDELPCYYQSAAVTVIPSHYESFGLVALESIACATPIVAGPVGIIPSLLSPVSGPHVTPAGCLVKGRSPEAWAGAISAVLKKRPRLNILAIDQLLAPYCWKTVASSVARLVNSKI